MPRPIKQLCAAADVVAELRRRSRSTTIGVRDRERADMILHRLDGVGVEAVAERAEGAEILAKIRRARTALDKAAVA